jgi:hypothetical protein
MFGELQLIVTKDEHGSWACHVGLDVAILNDPVCTEVPEIQAQAAKPNAAISLRGRCMHPPM